MDGFHIFPTFSELSKQDQELVVNAQKATENSYSPYSNYRVGAAVRLASGQILLGSNQENASYPAGLCAERVALFHISSTYPDAIVESIATVAKRKGNTKFKPVTPCGICRQVMLELEIRQKSNIRVLMQSPDERWIISENTRKLLPFSFEQDNL